jgi:hypothetical protein
MAAPWTRWRGVAVAVVAGAEVVGAGVAVAVAAVAVAAVVVVVAAVAAAAAVASHLSGRVAAGRIETWIGYTSAIASTGADFGAPCGGALS